MPGCIRLHQRPRDAYMDICNAELISRENIAAADLPNTDNV